MLNAHPKSVAVEISRLHYEKHVDFNRCKVHSIYCLQLLKCWVVGSNPI